MFYFSYQDRTLRNVVNVKIKKIKKERKRLQHFVVFVISKFRFCKTQGAVGETKNGRWAISWEDSVGIKKGRGIRERKRWNANAFFFSPAALFFFKGYIFGTF